MNLKFQKHWALNLADAPLSKPFTCITAVKII
jgi:hypothetical protein